MSSTRYGVSTGDRYPEESDWARVSFAPILEPDSPELQALRSAFETDRSWDRVAAATFVVDGLTSAMTTWMAQKLSDNLFPYVSRLIRQPALADALTTFAPAAGGRTSFQDPDFDRMSPLLLAGSIADVMANGGAYDDGPPMADAIAITQRWLTTLFGSRYDDLRVAESEGAWTDWFYDIVPSWDRTWLITDIAHQRATLLCVTDTD